MLVCFFEISGPRYLKWQRERAPNRTWSSKTVPLSLLGSRYSPTLRIGEVGVIPYPKNCFFGYRGSFFRTRMILWRSSVFEINAITIKPFLPGKRFRDDHRNSFGVLLETWRRPLSRRARFGGNNWAQAAVTTDVICFLISFFCLVSARRQIGSNAFYGLATK